MIIACPACTTRYAVPDTAIGVEGRTVRCAKCRHSWFQNGPVLETRAATSPAPEPSLAPASVAHSPAEPGPVADQQAAEPPVSDGPIVERGYAERAMDDYDDDYSSFAHEPPFRARRNPARMWMMAASLFAVIALGAVGAVAYYGLPDWVPMARPTFAEAQDGLKLDFPPNRQDRRTLPNGTEFFGASGTITNTGTESRSVPNLLILLRDTRERIVYRMEVAAPKQRLAPGESVTINEAVTDVPKSAKIAEIGWSPN